MNINWKNDKAKKLFEKVKLDNFADFWDIEAGDHQLKLVTMREHSNRQTKKVDRKMLQISFGDEIYYMKRASENAFQNIINEFNAINKLPDFGLKPSEIAGWSFDEKEKKGFIILEDLKGFFSIKQLIRGKTPPENLDDFIARKDKIFEKIAKTIKNIYKNNYTYPDWFAKHIYIKKGSEEIALIDLERFLPLNKCPWYFGLPIISFFIRKKIYRKLIISLERESDLLSQEYLENIFKV